MPVFNGADFIEQAISSILSQTFTDFELIISDNASTDETEEICWAASARDERVEYVRLPENRGVFHNFNHVFTLARGEYFKWAAYDDLCGADFVRLCVEVLDQDPDVVLACPRAVGIDETGQAVSQELIPGPGQPIVDRVIAPMDESISVNSNDPVKRLRRMMKDMWWTSQLYGVIRSDVLARTGRHAEHYMGDHVLLAELALHGRFYEIPEDLFFVRVHPGQTSRGLDRSSQEALSRSDDFNRSTNRRRAADAFARLGLHIASIKRAPLTTSQRLRGYGVMAGAIWAWVWDRGTHKLANRSR